VRATRYVTSLRDGDARAWLFTIVRNTWYSRVSRKANRTEGTRLNDGPVERPDHALDPKERLLQQPASCRADLSAAETYDQRVCLAAGQCSLQRFANNPSTRCPQQGHGLETSAGGVPSMRGSEAAHRCCLVPFGTEYFRGAAG